MMHITEEILETLKLAMRAAHLPSPQPNMPYLMARRIVKDVAKNPETVPFINALLLQQSPGSTTAHQLLTKAHDDFACRILEVLNQ